MRGIRGYVLVVACAAVGPTPPAGAGGLAVLSRGKVAILRSHADATRARGTIRFSRDPRLVAALDPRCPIASRLELSAMPMASDRIEGRLSLPLDCGKWRATGARYRYDDPTAVRGVRSIRYGNGKLVIGLRGAAFVPPPAPAAYVQLWFEIGDTRFHGRFHEFRRNEAGRIVTRRPSSRAAAGEAAFWDVLHGDDSSPARQDDALRHLAKAAQRSKRDGRSRFLLAMMRLYRFGQQVVRYDDVPAAAVAELAAADAAFDAALPLLWDRTRGVGDSRVPGFAGAAKFSHGLVTGDATLRDRGLAHLREAVAVNPFFNVFDLIPILQAVGPFDPLFTEAFAVVDAYLSQPDTIACVQKQPELCADAGLAPRNVAGALTLFGDVQAKVGNVTGSPGMFGAETWYALAMASAAGWRFADALDERVGHAAERAALYRDDDPANDPSLIGAASEACAVCHNR